MAQAKLRHPASLLLACLACALLAPSPAGAAGDFRLRKGARGKLCVDCHDGIQEVLQKRFVHTPLAEGDCTGCHNPHTSNHDKLLGAEPDNICQECHDDMVVPDAQSTHQVFLEGKCVSCHDPHATDNKNVLLEAGSKLCFECHEAMGEKIASNEFGHEPVLEDCLECHNPHLSEKSTKLLKEEQPTLCLDCHKAAKPSFTKAHREYPVQQGRCSHCHDPHGSNTAGILFDNVHEPVSDRECDECHVAATSSSPFALKDSGYEVCEGCHYETVADAFNETRIHWPLVDKTGCINCHAPHASAQDALLKEPMLELCGSCHSDTIARQERSQTEHPPIAEGECTECHSPHSSRNLFLLSESSLLEVCEGCHEWQTHSTHPIGEDIIDPRNENVSVQCLSCHRTHGTEYNHFIYFDETNDMCVQCHTEYRR
jgi:predicted CXXCH cytochrome family protein